jgi:dTDP-4-amino-4,6-dideoxygalactose transaminase
VHFIPLHLHPYWQQKLSLNPDSFPLAKQAFERAISLPIYTKMSEDDIARVIFATKELLSIEN